MFKKLSILFLLILSFSMNTNAKPISSTSILNKLEPFWSLLETIRTDLEEISTNKYTARLEQSYDFIIMDLRDAEEQIFLELKYQAQSNKKLICYSFYCADEKRSKKIKTQTNKMLGAFDWDEKPTSLFELNNEQINYLDIADRIASLGNDIDAEPSDYASIIITEDCIRLSQSNHRNSRSLDHKKTYLMRDLVFTIPLKNKDTQENKSQYGKYYLGEMEIYFKDASAEIQKETGDNILKQIKEEIENYFSEKE